MSLQKIIASHLRYDYKQDHIFRSQELKIDGVKCQFTRFLFDNDRKTVVQRIVYETDLRDMDPRGIKYCRISGPVMLFRTAFHRPVVKCSIYVSDKLSSTRMEDELCFELKNSIPPEGKKEIKRTITELAASGKSHSISTSNESELELNIKDYACEVHRLTSDLDFSSHDGAGVLEQHMEVIEDSFLLKFHQFRKGDKKWDGPYLDSEIPLWGLKSDIYVDRYNAENGQGLPSIHIHVSDTEVPLKFRFSGPESFEHKCTWERIYSQSIADCERLQFLFGGLIPSIRDLAFLRSS